ncbi:MAG: hypothetical protein IPM55_17855 [Acidobacteria bacterium]|nr:hypothetical protein [Acidobacteriota bacterium]
MDNTSLPIPPRNPEVVDLAELLIRNGRGIEGAGTPTITITGVEALGGGRPHHIIPDRIETGTFIVAAAITGGALKSPIAIPATCWP